MDVLRNPLHNNTKSKRVGLSRKLATEIRALLQEDISTLAERNGKWGVPVLL